MNLVFCFDGTSQSPQDAIHEAADDKYAANISNIAKLHLLCGGDFQNDTFCNSFYLDEMAAHQVSFYYSGVGTYGNPFRRMFNALYALGDAPEILDQAMSDLRKVYRPGDKIFAIGFSRGAALARRFCATASKEPDMLGKAKVEMLICLDTVVSIGMPYLSKRARPTGEAVFEDGKLPPNVVQALHCCALDENRILFQPTLMNKEDRVTEVWFAGDHLDVGGGRAGRDGLASVVLQFVLDEISRRKVGLKILSTEEVKLEQISAATEGVVIGDDNLEFEPNARGHNHQKPASWYTDGREIVVTENDQYNGNETPVVHHTVVERILNRNVLCQNYEPENLCNVPHRVLLPDTNIIQMRGLDDYSRKSRRSWLAKATTIPFRHSTRRAARRGQRGELGGRLSVAARKTKEELTRSISRMSLFTRMSLFQSKKDVLGTGGESCKDSKDRMGPFKPPGSGHDQEEEEYGFKLHWHLMITVAILILLVSVMLPRQSLHFLPA